MPKPSGSNTRLRPAWILAFLVAGSIAFSWGLSGIVSSFSGNWNNRLNDAFFRLRYRLQGSVRTLPTIAFVDLTDNTVSQLGITQGDRTPFATLFKVLSHGGVQSVLVDIVFPGAGSAAGDEAFAQAADALGVVYEPIVLLPHRPGPKASMPLPESRLIAGSLWHPIVARRGKPDSALSAFTDYLALARGARGLGSINAVPDADGIFRRIPLLFRFGDGFVPNIALRAACDALRVDPNRIKVYFGSRIVLPDAHLHDGSVRDIDIPIDQKGRMIIDFAGPWGVSFPHYSFAKLVAAASDPSLADLVGTDLDGMQLFISDVTTTSGDYGPTPFESVYPLCGLHANVLNDILTDQFLKPPGWWQTLLGNLLFAIFLWGAATRLRSTYFSIAALLGCGVFAGVQFWLFMSLGLMPRIMEPSIGLIVALIAVNSYRYLQVERDRLLFRMRLERYFAPTLMSKILQSPDRLMAVEKKVMTVLFSDIANFTSWCVTQPPDRVRDTLNEYFALMTEIVFRNEGTVDKFIGDGMMAFFGDPIEQPDHSIRAVHSAIEMQRAVRELRKRWSETDGLPIHVRIGINSGEMVVGDMGSDRIMAYTAIGSNVNLSSRLEGMAPLDGILISETVYRSVKDQFETRFAGKRTAKGIRRSFDTYEVIVG